MATKKRKRKRAPKKAPPTRKKSRKSRVARIVVKRGPKSADGKGFLWEGRFGAELLGSLAAKTKSIAIARFRYACLRMLRKRG